jgi:tetratricopeptide (TPR) repeat protein
LPTRQILLAPMSCSELERTIVEPAKKVGLAFDPPGLVQQILNEAGEDEGMLPLLQYALKESWARRKGDTITGDSYARSGGVREAIRLTAERTFDALSPQDQQVARQLFLRLVTPGEGNQDTRARAAMPVDQAQRKIVEQFASQRTRLLVTGFDRAARPTVEVAHEALIRTWPRFRQWIDSNREKLRSRAAILQAKADWEQHGRREDLLLPAGFQLGRARALLAEPGDLTVDDIREFIELSFAREENERKQKEAEEARAPAIATARLWQRSGRKPGYLPFGAALKEAERYADAAPEVREMVAAGRSRARRLFVYVGITIVVLLSVIPLGNFIFDQYQKKVVIPAREEAWNAILKSTTASASEKAEAIRELAKNDLSVDLTNTTLDDVTVNGIEAQGAKFIQAHLNNVRFERSHLSNAAFSQSAIVGGKFDKTSLELSRFDGAMIADTSFSNANLYRSIFDRALFCQSVQFSISDVRSASFRYVTFDGGHVPQFNGTAWWLAVGWSMQQIQSLAAQSSGVNYKDTPAFKNEMQYYDKLLSTAPEPTLARAMALNGKAWALATYGVDLVDAERLSQESLTIIRRLAEKPDESGSVVREEVNNMDTLAYIQMQAGQIGKALENLRAAVQKAQENKVSLGGDIIFRYALAQFAAGDRDEAIKNLTLAVDNLKYVPSHEMYLLRRYIKDEFLTTLQTLISKNLPISAPPPATCPANARG